MSSTQGQVIEVTFNGFGGSRIDPPEPGEGRVYCQQCDAVRDATLGAPEGNDTAWVQCSCGHEFYAELMDLPPDQV